MRDLALAQAPARSRPSSARPASTSGRHHAMAVADPGVDAVVARDLADVGQDRRAVGDRLGVLPRPEGVAQRVHVGVRADAGIAEQIPGAAAGLARLEDGVALARALVLQVPGRADARQARAHDQDVEVFAISACKIGKSIHIPNIIEGISRRKPAPVQPSRVKAGATLWWRPGIRTHGRATTHRTQARRHPGGRRRRLQPADEPRRRRHAAAAEGRTSAS